MLPLGKHNYLPPPILQSEQIDYFDAIFARAVYKLQNKPLKEWREMENIFNGILFIPMESGVLFFFLS